MKTPLAFLAQLPSLDQVDHAALQSDRWFFVATLIALAVVIIVIWRWMVNDRDKLAARLTDITDLHIAGLARMAEVVANNTAALRENKEVLEKVKGKL